MKRIEDNVCDSFCNRYMDTPEERMELLRYDRAYRLKTIISGSMLETEVYPVVLREKAPRAAVKIKRSYEEESAIYAYRRRKYLARLIEKNFDSGSWVGLTYDGAKLPKSEDAAKKSIVNYIARLKYYIKKHNLAPLKYIYTTEQHDKDGVQVRVHHHLICNFANREVLEQLWTGGSRVNARAIQPDENGLVGMSSYVLKASEKGKKTYCTSQGLKEPTIYTADSKITKRKASRMAYEYAYAAEQITKLYPEYRLMEFVATTSDYFSGVYLYARLRKQGVQSTALEQLIAQKNTQAQVKRLRNKLDSIIGYKNELESIKRQLPSLKRERAASAKATITRLTKRQARLLQWFDSSVKKMDTNDRAILRDKYINGVALEQLARMYHYSDKSAVHRRITKILEHIKQ